MTGAEVLLLDGCIKELWAKERLRDHGGDLTPQSLHDLILQAGGTEDEAQYAAAKRTLELERQRTSNGGE